MTTTCPNNVRNQPRRSLNDTIAYLDKMIDGLSEAIPGTIKDVLQESVGAAVSEGVRAALTEILTNTEILALLRSTLLPELPVAPPFSSRPSLLKALGSKLVCAARSACGWFTSALGQGASSVARCVRGVANRLTALRQRLQSLWQHVQALRQLYRPLALALGVGSLAALAAWLAPGWVAAVLSGVGGAGAALAVQVGLWLRKGLNALAAASS